MATTTRIQCPPCTICGKGAVLTVSTEGAQAWRSGVLIQNAFPTLTPAQRELLISGTHSECWDELFKEED